MTEKPMTTYPFGPLALDALPVGQGSKVQVYVSRNGPPEDASSNPDALIHGKRFIGRDGKPTSIADILKDFGVMETAGQA